MTRIHNDNPIWVCCCCGCLPWLGIVKGVLFGIPVALYVGCGITLISILCLPHDLYLVYRVVFSTVLLGNNLRFLFLLLLPFAAIVYLPSCCLISFVGGLLFCIGTMMFSVFDDNEAVLLGGVKDMCSESHNFVSSFYEFNTEAIFDYATQYDRIPHGWDGQIYEIPLSKVAIGLFLAVYGSLIGTLFVLVICAVKFPALLFVANKTYLKLFEMRDIHWLLFFLIGWAALNALSPLALAAAAVYGLSDGLRCAMEALKSDSVRSGLLQVRHASSTGSDPCSVNITKKCQAGS